MQEINLKVTAISLAIDAKADDVMALAAEIYTWLLESQKDEEVANNVIPLKPVN